ncbi:CHASE2 domain-containing protein [Enterovirga aerilata]|uniref:Adenylate/guanylate cyclase domain-containing protein n=1 Tax=Enterovirga aerilata TaxID=2730920 RepID=A0A849I5G9_9HYPH|nr:adenylate/guanylate cyclase domain-containing protein [Enterovirga sp. DB1703]NNM75106.1 adenylate/guanylate cyclase domain-containing protein [Enterovirga sp. DB1703]
MRLRTLRAAHATLAVALALAWAGALALRHLEGRASFLDRIEAPLLDLRFLLSGPRPAPADVLIVAIDEEAVREAGSFPLRRSAVARLVRAIHGLGAASVGVDILLVDPGDERDDAALASALAETGAVIGAAAIFNTGAETAGTEPGLPEAARVLWPHERFRGAAAIGAVNVAADQGGTPRHVPLLVSGPDGVLPSFPLQLAARAAGANPTLGTDLVRIGPLAVPTDLGWTLPLRFYGPRGAIPTVSAAALLRGAAEHSQFERRVVLLGATAVGTADSFATPFDPVMPGVEVLATAAAHLRHGDGLVRDGRARRIDGGAAVALAAATALAFALLPPAGGLLISAALAAAWLLGAVLAFRSGIWLGAVLPFAAMAPGVAFGIVGRQALDRIRTLRLLRSEEALRRFQAPALAARIAADPSYLAEPVAQDAAVLFLDLSGFTGASERLGPERTRNMLKEFHAVVCDTAERRGGVVINFMGDGAMVLFGVPDPAPDDAARALRASAEMVEAVRDWLANRTDGLASRVGVRVGAHHGPVVLSRLGSAAQEQITATGDSVNVASRLMEVGKGLGAALVVSADLIRAAGSPPDFLAAVDGRRRVGIRGRVEPLEIAYRWTAAASAETGGAS